MAGGYSEKDINNFITASRTGKLSTRHRNFVNQFAMTPAEIAEDAAREMSPANMRELAAAMRDAPSDEIFMLLAQEKDKIVDMVAAQNSAKSSPKVAESPSFVDQITQFFQTIWSNK
jgi:hypothetical protein